MSAWMSTRMLPAARIDSVVPPSIPSAGERRVDQVSLDPVEVDAALEVERPDDKGAHVKPLHEAVEQGRLDPVRGQRGADLLQVGHILHRVQA
jgi:hypothetical protein